MRFGSLPGVFMVAGLFSLFTTCKTAFQGDPLANLPPETYLVADTIIRFGENRLPSEIELQWWGDDPDGFVQEFEFTLDSVTGVSTTWQGTQKQDSIFLLPTPPGADSSDFQFYVRSIDNYGTPDPTPARLVLPVKNSPPTVAFLYTGNYPVTSFPVLRYYWQGNDPDAASNISRYEVQLNDTTAVPYPVNATVTGIMIEATDLQASVSPCRVYLNNNTTPELLLLPGMLMNDSNILYVRVVDQAEAKSSYAAARAVWVKKTHGTVLLVEGYTSGAASITEFYTGNLMETGINDLDTLQIFHKSNGAYTQQSPDNLSQAKIFSLFETIIWYSGDAAASLSIGQRTLDEFFNQGGKLLMSIYVSSLFDEQSDFLDFTPVQSLIIPADTTLILSDTSVLKGQQAGYENLLSTSFVGVVFPFVPVPGASALYDATLIARDDNNLSLTSWGGISTVVAGKPNAFGNTNFILSTLELHKLNGYGNMNSFFDMVIHQAFNW